MAFNLSRYDLTEITRRIELPEITAPGNPTLILIVRYAGIGNRCFENAQFKMAAAQPKDPAAPPPSDLPVDPEAALAKQLETSEQRRREIAQFYAGSVIVGWENLFDDEAPNPTNPVPFDLDTARRLAEELMFRVWPIWRDRILAYVSKESNFRTASAVPDPADLGKG